MKKAVVTFITNEKEFLYPPVFDFVEVDFLCFTDLKDIKSQFWKICPLNGLSIDEIKDAPKKHLSQYDEIVFTGEGAVITKGADGNIKVVEKPDISECFDWEYFNEVKNMVTGVQANVNASETHLHAHTEEREVYPLKLTIGMLVGRKSPYFDECFASILRIMEAIPESELIIVDTGNEDGSVDKVRKVAQEGQNITIVCFAWIHNFAAARNEAVKRARGAWYMTLDDDEWFEDISAVVDFFENEKLCEKCDYAGYTQRNYMDKEGKTYTESTIIRLAKNRNDLCYVGRIHEQFNYREKENISYVINSYVHHYGYVENEESRKLKSQRNMALLAIANEEEPTDSHVIVQIVQEMMFTKRVELAYAYLQRGLSVQRFKPNFHMSTFISVLGYILNVVSKDEIWNYEKDYVKKISLNYIEMAAVVYQYAFVAWKTVLEINEGQKSCEKRQYIDKAIEYSIYFEKAYYDYNNASVNTQLAIKGAICENYCVNEKALMDMLVIRALAFVEKEDDKEAVAVLRKINPDKIKICAMEYYAMLVRYDIASLEFYYANETVSTIWMLFIQALLQKPALCAELLKCIETPDLDRIITEAKPYVNSAEKGSYNQAFEELVVLRLVSEYMQNGEYNMAINALKIALQGSEQAKAVALILFEELKALTS